MMFLNRLEKRLKEELPGVTAQMRMAPKNRPFPEIPEKPILAAVVILLYQQNGIWYTVLIKRNNYQGPHSGQISLPGGRMEVYDPSLQEAAIREAVEELGIARIRIHIIEKLTPLHIPASNYLVHPFAGFYEGTPFWQPDSAEVRYVIEASLSQLLDPANVKSGIIHSGDRSWYAPYYDINGEKIWGATAMIISEFLEVVRSVEFSEQ